VPRFSPPTATRFCYKNKRTFLALLVCVRLGFPLCLCVCVSWQSVSQPLLLLPSSTPYTLHHPPPTHAHIFLPPPTPISLASCHRLGLTGKRKHNQKDNVIMPQCGTIYTKLNTATKKINISCLSSCHPFLHPPTPLLVFHRFFSAFPYSTHLSFFRLVLLLPFFFYF